MIKNNPFRARFDGGRCAFCRRRISKGDEIVRLDKVVTWIESKRLVPRGGGRFFTDQQSSQYAHAKCQEAKDETE